MITFIIILSIGIVIGFVAYGVLFVGDRKVSGLDVIEKENKNEVLIEKKEENKKRILELFESKSKITNNEVENLLGVSDSTVGRYLDELEEERKIKQVGETGQSVYYVKK